MTTEIQYRRGTTAEHAAFTGAVGEITVNTDNDSLVVHDGLTAGGFETASIVGLATKASQTALDSTDAAVAANTSAVLANATSLGLKANILDLYTKISEPGSEGTAGQLLKTDGVGGRTWVTPTDTNTTYVSSDFDHDNLTGFVANEHIDWTIDQGATNVHANNYTDTDTTYSVGDAGLTEINFTTALDTKLSGIEALADVTDATNVAAAGAIMEPTEGTSGYVLSTDGAGVRTWIAQTGGVTQGAVDLKADQTDLDTLEAVVVEGLGAFATDISANTTDISANTTAISANTTAIAGISGGSVNYENNLGAADDLGGLTTPTPDFAGEVDPVLTINCSIGYQTFDLGSVA